MSQATVTIPREFQNRKDLVAIPTREYQELIQMKAEMDDALEKIENGERELKEGKTKTIKSVRELM